VQFSRLVGHLLQLLAILLPSCAAPPALAQVQGVVLLLLVLPVI
jgi:hypothetical protein